jgi:tRNA-uridine 2-sulfurtransferase
VPHDLSPDERARAASLSNHLEFPVGRGHTPGAACTGAAGGAACGDLVRLSLSIDPADRAGTIVDAGFDAAGCGAAIAAGSAAVSLVRGAPLLAACRVGAEQIARELGGLSASKRHAAELAADALHRAIGAGARTRAQLADSPGRTLVAMSGGVDSAVAALLVAEEGREVVGVTLELWSDPENDGERSCCSPQAVRAARAVAHGLGLPHVAIDLRAEFRAGVVEPWLSEHVRGLTPYPCVRCNGSVRLDAMLALAERLGASTLATGHYARLHHDRDCSDHERDCSDHEPDCSDEHDWSDHERERPAPLLRVAADVSKDQSYALAGLAPDSLARLRFPLGALSKADVRELAARAGLAVAEKPDSQDLCFLAGTNRSRFLERHGRLRPGPGPIIDLQGKAIGTHSGHAGYTVGQRHGLGIGGGPPLFVLATDARANTVTAGPRRSLLTRSFEIEKVTLRRRAASVDSVKLRSRGARVACRLAAPAQSRRRSRAALELGDSAGSRATVELAQPAERTAPGQLACLYAGDALVGRGTIVR